MALQATTCVAYARSQLWQFPHTRRCFWIWQNLENGNQNKPLPFVITPQFLVYDYWTATLYKPRAKDSCSFSTGQMNSSHIMQTLKAVEVGCCYLFFFLWSFFILFFFVNCVSLSSAVTKPVYQVQPKRTVHVKHEHSHPTNFSNFVVVTIITVKLFVWLKKLRGRRGCLGLKRGGAGVSGGLLALHQSWNTQRA